jgi:DNA-binding NarL/FixJ family response regulator
MQILLVDDHALIREALRGVLKELEGSATVLEAPNGRQALRLIEDHPGLNMVLLDLNLPDRDGLALLEELGESHPAISIVVLSASHDRDKVMRAFDLGALGFIPKSASREVMINALRLIFSGGIYIPPEILARPESPRDASASASPADIGLSSRQAEVLALMMQGKSNKAICRMLSLAEPTVKNHVTSILKALKVSNRTEAVVKAGTLGWDLTRISE